MRALLPALLLLAAGSARADLAAHDVEQLHVPEDGRGLLAVQGGSALAPGTLRLQLTVHYERDAVVLLDEQGKRVGGVLSNRLTAELGAALALHERLELRLSAPIIPVQGGDSLPGLDVPKPRSFSFSTVRLGAKVPLLFEAEQFVDLSALGTVTLPSALSGAYAADPGVGFAPQLAASRSLGPVRLHASAGVLLRKDVDLGTGKLGMPLFYGGGATYGLPGIVDFEAGVFGQKPLSSTSASGTTSIDAGNGLEGLVGVSKPLGWLRLYGGAGAGFTQAVGTPAYRIIVGVADEIPLWGREEPKQPEPVAAPLGACDPKRLSGPEAQRPRPQDCPDLDNDGDGLANKLDRCPEEPGPRENFGCPSTVPPAPPEEAAKDSDGDGIPDALDRCPTQPEDKDGFEDQDGCPEPDNDHDGVADKQDRCPNVAGPVENFGCPPVDADGDGVPDLQDNCPNVPGPRENQGCPLKERQLVVITRTKLEIKDKVYFETNKSKILPRSFRLLDNVAGILKTHPEIEHLSIEGHTDNQGNRAHNLQLSQDRANSVKAYLVRKGVEASRLEAVGYGPDRPATSNASAKGREQNRRVEFVVVGQELPATELPVPGAK